MGTEEHIKRLENTISALYDQLAVLVATRCVGQLDAELEAQITRLTRRLRLRQAQEADLIRATAPPLQSSAVRQGLAILRRVEGLRRKYGQ